MIWHGWLLYNVRCVIWVFSKYREFRLFISMYADSMRYCITMILMV